MARRTKRKDGYYSSNFTYEGVRYYIYGHSAAELRDKEIQKRKSLKAGTKDQKNPKLDDYYITFTENRRNKVRESTIRSQTAQYRNCASVVINSNGLKLGQARIRDIKPADIQKVQKALENNPKKSTETVNNCMAHLSHVFNAAVRDETINRNPCRCLEKVQRTEKPARETIHRALTEEETKRFFEAAADSYYLYMFRMMIKTGMRIGELGALSEFDIDEKAGTLHINKTVTRNELGGYEIGKAAKTYAGTRTIPVGLDVLQAVRDQRSINLALFGERPLPTIFRSAEGELLREYPVNREIKRICKRIGIEKFTCHAFRATFATRFIEQRPQDYKALSELLGHSNTKITLDLYTHVTDQTKIKAMRNIFIAV